MGEMGLSSEDVYATLLLNDNYLPGALVLAHSLRDAGTAKKLAVLFTPETVSKLALKELHKIFDYIIPVERIVNKFPANLILMNRPELQSTFTKILLWKQTQFRKVVYLDSDVFALRAPDELFDITHPFSAAPDIGWPDIFNSGLMVLSPNMTDYNSLISMAQEGTSFDGADQGLLNMYFGNNFNRLSFTYNVTPSSHYQYLPAYRHFQSKISIVHFIGQNKPWSQEKYNKNGSPFDEMLEMWWAIYQRHYDSNSNKAEPFRALSESKVEIKSNSDGKVNTVVDSLPDSQGGTLYDMEKTDSSTTLTISWQPSLDTEDKSELSASTSEGTNNIDKPTQENPQYIGEESSQNHSNATEISCQKKEDYCFWDASRNPPPTDSKPEALSFPETQYMMSSDPSLFKAPERYPDPPKNMWFEVPETPIHQEVSQIFPWEKDCPKPCRVFVEDSEIFVPSPARSPDPPKIITGEASIPLPPQKVNPIFPWENDSSKPSRVFAEDSEMLIPSPVQFPDPPKIVMSEASIPPLPRKVNPIFPSENDSSKPYRVFAEDSEVLIQSPVRYSDSHKNMKEEVSKPQPRKLSPIFPWEYLPSTPSRVFAEDKENFIPSLADLDKRLAKEKEARYNKPMMNVESHKNVPLDIWQSYTRMNAWDEVPEIKQYVGELINDHRGKLIASSRQTSVSKFISKPDFRAQDTRLMGPPADYQRSVLPVTPALEGRSKLWGKEVHDNELPSAEGVPSQEEWDPTARLEKLAHHQKELLARKLGHSSTHGRDIHLRGSPFESEESILLKRN